MLEDLQVQILENRSKKISKIQYKLCFGRVEEVRPDMLDTELAGSLQVCTGQNL
jgi:hypothetical protein